MSSQLSHCYGPKNNSIITNSGSAEKDKQIPPIAKFRPRNSSDWQICLSAIIPVIIPTKDATPQVIRPNKGNPIITLAFAYGLVTAPCIISVLVFVRCIKNIPEIDKIKSGTAAIAIYIEAFLARSEVDDKWEKGCANNIIREVSIPQINTARIIDFLKQVI